MASDVLLNKKPFSFNSPRGYLTIYKQGMQQLETLGIVCEITGQQRNRVFAYQQYLSTLNEGTETS